MITENELRIGNHILLNGKIDTVTGIFYELSEDRNKKFDVFIQAANDLDYKLEDCSEVLLTPEILNKCGAFYNNHNWLIGIVELNHTTTEEYFEFEFQTPFMKWEIIPIKHLHQLQNLYFALTGTELNIEL